MNASNWYKTLIKPRWSPPSWVFGPVWTILYVIIAASFGVVFVGAFSGKIPFTVALPFALNLVFNFLFTPLQFGFKNNFLAAVDICLILATLAAALLMIWPYQAWIVYANLPYLLWVTFATVLQISITYLNKKQGIS